MRIYGQELMPQSFPHLSRPLVVAFVVFLLATVASTSLIGRLERDELQEQRARASNLAIGHAHGLRVGIERALSATYALEALIRQGIRDKTINPAEKSERLAGTPQCRA